MMMMALYSTAQDAKTKMINPLKCMAPDGYIYKNGQRHPGLTYGKG